MKLEGKSMWWIVIAVVAAIALFVFVIPKAGQPPMSPNNGAQSQGLPSGPKFTLTGPAQLGWIGGTNSSFAFPPIARSTAPPTLMSQTSPAPQTGLSIGTLMQANAPRAISPLVGSPYAVGGMGDGLAFAGSGSQRTGGVLPIRNYGAPMWPSGVGRNQLSPITGIPPQQTNRGFGPPARFVYF